MNDNYNEDWIKTLSWDLPSDLDGFLGYLGVKDASLAAKRQAVAQFSNLPAAEAMPDDLRRQLQEQRI